MTRESVRAEQAPRNGLKAPESAWGPGVGSPGGSTPGSGPQTGTEGFQSSKPAPLQLPHDAAEALYAALGAALGAPQSDRDAELAAALRERDTARQMLGGDSLRLVDEMLDTVRQRDAEVARLQVELDQLRRDCDARDETIRHLDAGLTRERERVAGLEAELVGVRSVVDRVRTLATQMRDWYDPHSVVSGWGRQALEALDASPAAAPQAVVDETPAEAAQAADLPTVIHRTPGQLRQQRAELIASTGLDETVLRERGKTFQLYPEHADAWQTVQGIDYLLAGETRTVEHPHA